METFTLNKWDKRFLDLAYTVSLWSKDPSTKVGCVIVGQNNEIRSTGYNGLPRNANDDIPERNTRPEKLFWYEHAERNAIYNAARMGTSLDGCIAYSTLCPCMDCARGLIQSGIVAVVCQKIIDIEKWKLWEEHFKRSEQLFKECNVKLVFEEQ